MLVTLEIENRAARVGHRWGNDVAYIVDDHGRVFENDAAAQVALARVEPINLKTEHVTPPGAEETTVLVFDVPADARHAFLRFRGQLLMGDVFDGDRFERTRVELF